MLQATNFDGEGHDMDIHVRTTISYGFSFIEQAAIQIGQDILEVAGFDMYAVNGVETPRLFGRAQYLAHYPIYQTRVDKKRYRYDVVLNPHLNVTLRTFKDMVSVSISGGTDTAKYFSDSQGLMGSFHGELLGRDGITAFRDMNAFGQEWQVTDAEPKLFIADRAPQYPEKCILPTPETSGLRRIQGNKLRHDAMRACAIVGGYKHNDCVQDVVSVGDLSVAKKYYTKHQLENLMF